LLDGSKTARVSNNALESPLKFTSANLDSLRKLYIDQLQQLHSAETQIASALPEMIGNCTEPGLKHALEMHLEETRGHVVRLDQILKEDLGKVRSKKNKGVAALISEGKELITGATDDSVRDAGIISAAQRVEHYEIAAYGTVRNFAEILGHMEHGELLDQTLEEEKRADAILTEISDSANTQADQAA
jgi:ferritin-like metal-binding protein YciE